MAEDRVNIVDALRGQQEQLKRLIAQKIWISDAPKATLSEIDAQLGELKRLLAQLQSDVQDQLKKGKYDPGLVETDPMKQRKPILNFNPRLPEMAPWPLEKDALPEKPRKPSPPIPVGDGEPPT